jgi:hypothetical protein
MKIGRRHRIPRNGANMLVCPAASAAPRVQAGTGRPWHPIYVRQLQVRLMSHLVHAAARRAPAHDANYDTENNGTDADAADEHVEATDTLDEGLQRRKAVRPNKAILADEVADGHCEFLRRGVWSTAAFIITRAGHVHRWEIAGRDTAAARRRAISSYALAIFGPPVAKKSPRCRPA